MQVLAQLKIPTRPEVLHGPETFDDAGVIAVPGTRQALVQTVDFFPPIVDDPREFGRIAAANALSDIYAMGALPFCALNLVGFPRRELELSVLSEILAGGAEKMIEAKVALLGGHSVMDNEIKYGLAVTGLVDPAKIITNGGARPGDRLVLTKPLGMGAVTASIQKDKANPEHVAAAIRSMAALNDGGARAVIAVGVHSLTDVTGFGLLGHGSEMARASKARLVFDVASLPLTLGARELAEGGCLSGGSARCRRFLGEHVRIAGGVAKALADLAFDAETSGGLLAAVAPERCADLVAALKRERTQCAAVIGEVLAPEGEIWVELR